jgi:hypothetical protein
MIGLVYGIAAFVGMVIVGTTAGMLHLHGLI